MAFEPRTFQAGLLPQTLSCYRFSLASERLHLKGLNQGRPTWVALQAALFKIFLFSF